VSSKVEDKKTCVLDLIAKGFSGKNPNFKFGSLCSQLNVGELSSTYDEFKNICGCYHRKGIESCRKAQVESSNI